MIKELMIKGFKNDNEQKKYISLEDIRITSQPIYDSVFGKELVRQRLSVLPLFTFKKNFINNNVDKLILFF